TNTAVAATELTARIEKKTAVSPTPISTQTVTPAADPPACTTPTRILPAGDSITQGQYSSTDAGYRLPLYLSLRNAGYDVQFVGQLMNGPTPGFDNNHEGYGGKKTQFFVVSLANWVEDQSADIVLYHIGTNDVPNGIDDAIINTNTILDQIDAKSTDVTVVVAQIINRTCNGPNCAVEQAATSTYNDNLQILVDDRVAVGDDLVIVDMEHDAQLSYFVEPAGDFANFLHPNDTGYEKMAAVWFDALASTLPTTCNTPPLIVQDAITTATVNNRYTHQLTASGYGTLNYSLTSAPDGMTIDPATGFISWIPSIAQIGSNSVIVEVTNTAGSDSYSFSIDVTNAGIAVIQKPYEVTLTSGSSLQYSVTITNTGATDLDPVIVDFPQTPSCNDSILLGAGVNTTITCDLTNITADLTHEVLVTGTNSVPEQFTASDVGTINIINPQLEIVKTTTTPTVLKGDPVTFNVSITNTGDVDLTNVFVVDADVADCDRPALGTLTQTQNISYSCSLVSATTDLVSSKITVTGTHQLGQISGTDTIDVDVIAPAIALGVDPHDQHILSGDNA
ncbi:MAG: hypothetical protein KC421_18695, partial [Anaerolineales bacterium]|nr:hypothetical protein [Anaerolineales bacterium]